MKKSAVWKYTLKPTASGACNIDMPVGAKILSAQTQHDDVCTWAIVDVEEDVNMIRETRVFQTVATGAGFEYDDKRMKFIDTVQFVYASGALVFHVFEYVNE